MRYVILNQGRTAGTAFGDAIHQTGVAGFVGLGKPGDGHGWGYELIIGTGPGLVEAVKKNKLETEYIKRGKTPNGVVGLKVNFPVMQSWVKFVGWEPIRKWLLTIDRFIILRRRDVIAQAVSLYLAVSENHWAAWQGPPNKRVNYSYNGIMWRLVNIQMAYGWIDTFCKYRKKPVIEMYTEDIVGDWPGAVRKVLQFIDVEEPPGVDSIVSRDKKEDDPRKKTWTKRFKEEYLCDG